MNEEDGSLGRFDLMHLLTFCLSLGQAVGYAICDLQHSLNSICSANEGLSPE